MPIIEGVPPAGQENISVYYQLYPITTRIEVQVYPRSIMSGSYDNKSVAASTSRKRSRTPSFSDVQDSSTKIIRQSMTQPYAASKTLQETSSSLMKQEPSSVGVSVSLPSTKPSKPSLIFIVNKKIPSSQLAHLKGIAKKKNFPLSADLK